MIIYLITNKINGKRYVGQTVNSAEHRWNQHVASSRCDKRSGVLLSAIRKYGLDSFEIRTLARCNDIEEMNRRETYYIRLFKTLAPKGYNLDSGGKNNTTHPDTKKKLSIAHTGKKRGPHSQSHRDRISESNMGRGRGIPLSEERRRKIGLANSGEKNGRFGKTPTPNNLRALSEANTGNKYWVGRKHKPESKDKISKTKDKFKKRVFCVTNNTIYESKHAASRALNVGRKEIGRNIDGDIDHVKGFVFKKVE